MHSVGAATNAALALIIAVATATLGCAFNHLPDMRAQLDKLPIPGSYQFLAAEALEQNPKFFGLSDLMESRYYRSPLDFDGTCDQVEAAFKVPLEYRFVDPSRPVYSYCQTRAQSVRSGWRAGFLSSYDVVVHVRPIPAKANRLDGATSYLAPPDAYTEVAVRIYYRR